MNKDIIWVLNSGSSSLKFCLFSSNASLELLAEGRITELGTDPKFSINGEVIVNLAKNTDQLMALKTARDWIAANYANYNLKAVGHRIVHGGEKYTSSCVLTPAVLEDLTKLIPLAPMHQPHNLAAVKNLAVLHPNLLQVGCFDTAFHAQHTNIFKHYALPKNLREQGVRRYGFHGLSYEWLATLLAAQYPQHASGRVVAAHLGNGASLCAMKNGVSIDTTMGLTALDGLPMGTRCGSIDPGVILYMLRELNLNVDAVEKILSTESGLKALSGISNDVRELLAANTADSKFALEFFATMTAQHVARMAVALGGIDTLVFTGGIGEHAEPVRQMILQQLDFMQPFKVLIVAANEERMIATHCVRIMHAS